MTNKILWFSGRHKKKIKMDHISPEISELKHQIDILREYIESDICTKCEEMRQRLEKCESLLYGRSQSNMANPKQDT